MDDHVVAAEGFHERGSTDAQEQLGQAVRSPIGRIHALKAGQKKTACGRPAAQLTVFGDQPWSDSGLDHCRGCLVIVPV